MLLAWVWLGITLFFSGHQRNKTRFLCMLIFVVIFVGKFHILKVWFDLIYFTNIFVGVGGTQGKYLPNLMLIYYF